MDTQRAMGIINSPDKIEVLYRSSPVWIQGVNGSLARVKYLESDRIEEVPVEDLIVGDGK